MPSAPSSTDFLPRTPSDRTGDGRGRDCEDALGPYSGRRERRGRHSRCGSVAEYHEASAVSPTAGEAKLSSRRTLGEMAALRRRYLEEVEGDALGGTARGTQLGAVVVMKGSTSFVVSPGQNWRYDGGTVGPATSGSGDVLAGIIAGRRREERRQPMRRYGASIFMAKQGRRFPEKRSLWVPWAWRNSRVHSPPPGAGGFIEVRNLWFHHAFKEKGITVVAKTLRLRRAASKTCSNPAIDPQPASYGSAQRDYVCWTSRWSTRPALPLWRRQ